MKNSCCNSKEGNCSWFCPTFVRVVVGVIVMSAGASKFLGGSQAMAWAGGSVLGVFGLDATIGALAIVAIILGYIAASIELLGGLLFALGCRKTSKYAAFGLAIVMFAALLVLLKNLKPIDETGFLWFTGVLSQVQLPLLLFAIFAQKSTGVFDCCKTSCCGTGKCDKK